MKKYFVIYASYLETEGLDASFQMFDTEEEAKENLKKEYNCLQQMFKDSQTDYSFDCNDLTEDSYSISCQNYYGFEKFEAYISKKEV